MATTVTQLQERLGLRLGDNGAETNTNEAARRLSYFNDCQRAFMRKHYWWFSEKTTSFNSVANQEKYGTTDGFPSDYRKMLELRYDGQLYTPSLQSDAFESSNTPYTHTSQEYMIFAKELYPIPVFPANGVANVTMKYYHSPAVLTSSSTVIVPDDFTDIYIAYARGVIQGNKGKRGSGADAFDEYNEILKDMTIEQNKYLFTLQQNSSSSSFFEG